MESEIVFLECRQVTTFHQSEKGSFLAVSWIKILNPTYVSDLNLPETMALVATKRSSKCGLPEKSLTSRKNRKVPIGI